MALAALFQISVITQPEARKMIRVVNALSCNEMLWAQLRTCYRQRSPWTRGWAVLIETIKEGFCRTDLQGIPEPEFERLQNEIYSQLSRDMILTETQEVREEMLKAKTTPIPEHCPDRMHEWAAHWLDYVARWRDGNFSAMQATYAANRENLLLRSCYADEQAVDGSQEQAARTIPAKPPRAPSQWESLNAPWDPEILNAVPPSLEQLHALCAPVNGLPLSVPPPPELRPCTSSAATDLRNTAPSIPQIPVPPCSPKVPPDFIDQPPK